MPFVRGSVGGGGAPGHGGIVETQRVFPYINLRYGGLDGTIALFQPRYGDDSLAEPYLII